MHEELGIDLFSGEEKKSRIYKFFDIFLTDDQKESIIISLLLHGVTLLSLFKPLREKLIGDIDVATVRTDTHIFSIGFEPPTKISGIMYKSRKGFFAKWKSLKLPEDIGKMLDSAKSKKECKKILVRLMRTRAFW
jgi:hypothetical protein